MVAVMLYGCIMFNDYFLFQTIILFFFVLLFVLIHIPSQSHYFLAQPFSTSFSWYFSA